MIHYVPITWEQALMRIAEGKGDQIFLEFKTSLQRSDQLTNLSLKEMTDYKYFHRRDIDGVAVQIREERTEEAQRENEERLKRFKEQQAKNPLPDNPTINIDIPKINMEPLSTSREIAKEIDRMNKRKERTGE